MKKINLNLKCVCIIAFDGLEYDLVEEFNLEKIKQCECGKIDVSLFKMLATPIVWASFITGVPPEEHGLDDLIAWRNPIIQKLRRLSIRLKLDRIGGKGKIFELLGFKRGEFYDLMVEKFKNRKTKTLFDVIANSKAFSVPPYQKWISDKTRFLMKEAVENEEKVAAFEEHVWSVFEEKREKCLEIIEDGNWNLFMAHFMFTDLLAHIYIGNSAKMFEVYAEAEKFVDDVTKILPEKTLLLIVSDHGMERLDEGMFGEHSDHGFYSSNVKLGLVNPKITDFFDLVVGMFESGV
ncbi:hypothetical protein DRO69_07205 [Candidatus Bathyarchaeota archaeon]|nr:MAG: hypothetical protein DRO69_07205 [Candidatus Bathyarchaeota archaeon]